MQILRSSCRTSAGLMVMFLGLSGNMQNYIAVKVQQILINGRSSCMLEARLWKGCGDAIKFSPRADKVFGTCSLQVS